MSLKTFQHEFWNSGSSPVSGAPCHSGTPLSKAASMPSPKSFSPAGPLRGSIAIPGDKSISHRSLMLSALAIGESVIEGLLEGEDVHATATALRAMGADIERGDDAVWRVNGVGVGGLLQPQTALDMGNSGTSTRLLMGLVASHAITVTFVGDASLSKRPMARVSDPLSLMGASFTGTPGNAGAQCLPMMVRGACPAVPIAYRLPMASAQVKSAILLAGLNTPGITRVIEPVPTRDHSERMLKGFGADIEVDIGSGGIRTISIRGEGDLKPQHIIVPGDPSSAAFPIVAALITPSSEVTVTNVGMNPTRAGLFDVLVQMGADLKFDNVREVGGEPVADITARHSELTGIDIPPEIAPSMIDEFPILFIAAAMARGVTRTSGLDELRVKESDRLALMAKGLSAIGVQVEEQADGLTIHGRSGDQFDGGTAPPVIEAALDHRIAMSFAVAGLNTRGGLTVDDMAPVATSFPGFEAMLGQLGSGQ